MQSVKWGTSVICSERARSQTPPVPPRTVYSHRLLAPPPPTNLHRLLLHLLHLLPQSTGAVFWRRLLLPSTRTASSRLLLAPSLPAASSRRFLAPSPSAVSSRRLFPHPATHARNPGVQPDAGCDVSGLWAVIMTVERALRSHAARALRSHAPSRVGLGPRAGAGQLEAHARRH